MFDDIGALELVALVIIAVLVFGPDKLPKLIQDVTSFIRKVRAFSDGAKEDIRKELGPQFKDFEFDDLNPKNFVRKHLTDGQDALGLKEIRNGFDFRSDLNQLADAVNGRELDAAAGAASIGGGGGALGATGASEASDPFQKRDPMKKDEPPPFDSDAT